MLAPLGTLDRLEFLREANGVLCHGKDEGIHPTGDFRIGVLLRTDPAISTAMSCPAIVKAGTKPACTLRGSKIQPLRLSFPVPH